ncbi:MAG TPA: glycosyltransferase [Planctomycetota bacterium]|nr:glycosyltransferase [Planctomycetota bacterium]
MHILIDASELDRAPPGARSYFRETVRHLLLLGEGHAYSLLGYPRRTLGPVAGFLTPLPRPARERLRSVDPGVAALSYSPLGMPAPVMASTRSAGARRTLPAVATLLDMDGGRDGWFGRKTRSPASRRLERASRVVTLTRSSLEALVERQGIEESRVRWIPPGLLAPAAAERIARDVELPLVPYVAAALGTRGTTLGSLRAAIRLLCAFRGCLRRGGKELRLLFLDGSSSLLRRGVLEAAAWLGLVGRVGFAPDRGEFPRTRLISSADAFILAERDDPGWLSGAEAMRRGVPILAPRGQAAAEIFGDSALYYSRESSRELQAALARILQSADLRRALAQRGIARAQAFPWEASAGRIIDVFAEVEAELGPVAPAAAAVEWATFNSWEDPQISPGARSSPTAPTSTGERA